MSTNFWDNPRTTEEDSETSLNAPSNHSIFTLTSSPLISKYHLKIKIFYNNKKSCIKYLILNLHDLS